MTKQNKRHGTNDAIEKKWLWNNEMFADVCNALLFDGKQVVQPNCLEPAEVLSYYGSSSRDQVFVQERDVAKVVTLADNRKVRVAFFGIENQSVPTPDMAIRVMGYDAASLCQQILDRKAGGPSVKYHAVKTIVLNYGKQAWGNTPRSLKEILESPAGVDSPFNALVNDYKIDVCDVAWLNDEEIDKFQSSFKYIAMAFVGYRTGDFERLNKELPAGIVAEVLIGICAILNDDSLWNIIKKLLKDKDEVVNMKKVLNPYTAYYVEQAEKKTQAEEAKKYQLAQAKANKKYQLAQAKEKVESFQRLVTKFGLTNSQAMEALNCTPTDLESYKKLIAESNDQE